MNKAWKMMKKGFDKKTTNPKEPILNPIRRRKRLEQRITTLYENDKIENLKVTREGDVNSKRTQTLTKSPSDVNYPHESQSELVLKMTSDAEKEGTDKDETKSISSKQKQTVVRKTRRCHMCRKRGHIQKDCPSKHMLRNWLRGEAKMCENTMQ